MACLGCSWGTQFQSISMPSSCATSAGWVAPLCAAVCRMEIRMLLSLTSVACILESTLSPTFCLHGNIHSTFGSSIHTVRKRVFQCNRIIITTKQYSKSNRRYFTIRIFKIFEEKWAEGTWKSSFSSTCVAETRNICWYLLICALRGSRTKMTIWPVWLWA